MGARVLPLPPRFARRFTRCFYPFRLASLGTSPEGGGFWARRVVAPYTHVRCCRRGGSKTRPPTNRRLPRPAGAQCAPLQGRARRGRRALRKRPPPHLALRATFPPVGGRLWRCSVRVRPYKDGRAGPPRPTDTFAVGAGSKPARESAGAGHGRGKIRRKQP